MYQLLFKNRLFALFFAAMIVLGVKTLIGTEGEEGLLTRKTAQIEANVQTLQDEARHFQAGPEDDMAPPEPAATAFVPEEELIDDTEGFVPEEPPLPPDVPDPAMLEIPPDIVLPDIAGGN